MIMSSTDFTPLHLSYACSYTVQLLPGLNNDSDDNNVTSTTTSSTTTAIPPKTTTSRSKTEPTAFDRPNHVFRDVDKIDRNENAGG